MTRFVRVFSSRKVWRGVMNNLIGKSVMFEKPVKDNRDVIYSYVARAGEVVDFTADLLQVLVVEIQSGELYVVPIEAVRVVQSNH